MTREREGRGEEECVARVQSEEVLGIAIYASQRWDVREVRVAGGMGRGVGDGIVGFDVSWNLFLVLS